MQYPEIIVEDYRYSTNESQKKQKGEREKGDPYLVEMQKGFQIILKSYDVNLNPSPKHIKDQLQSH